MPTAACGLNCDVCRLNLLDICSSCGSGKSREGAAKAAAQKELLGQSCRILSCAILNQIEYCPRDCQLFPCENFRDGLYPYSEGYLNMQERRRKENARIKTPEGDNISVPPEFWDDLEKKSIDDICENAVAGKISDTCLVLPFLHEEIIVDIGERSLWKATSSGKVAVQYPYLELMIVVYLNHAKSIPLRDEMVAANDLKTAHFFQGPHILRTEPVVQRYGNDLDGFNRAAEYLNGSPIDMGDAGFMFLPFPRIPLYYILWKGDDEFKPHLTILFDKSIEHHLAADAIWGTVNLASYGLTKGPGWRL